MYAKDALVVYGAHGVCKVSDVEERNVDGKAVSYYVLIPVDQPGAKYYVPRHNDAAVAKVRPLLTKDALESLLRSDETQQDSWIPDESRRKQRYRELICSGDRTALLCMVNTLHRQKQLQLSAGRKFHLCDENFLRDAEKLLSSEFALVLGMSQSQAIEYIRNILNI